MWAGDSGKTGDSAPLQLIASQYNAEYGQVVSKPISLKVGRNEIMVPELVTFDAEHGGALYVQYTGSSTCGPVLGPGQRRGGDSPAGPLRGGGCPDRGWSW